MSIAAPVPNDADDPDTDTFHSSGSKSQGASPRKRSMFSRNWWIIGVAATCVVTVLGLVLFFASGQNGRNASTVVNGIARALPSTSTRAAPNTTSVATPQQSVTSTVLPAPTSGNPISSADDFLARMHARGIVTTNGGDKGLVDAANIVCSNLRAGSNIHAEANALLQPPNYLSSSDAGYFAGEAIKVYCPQFSNQLAADPTAGTPGPGGVAPREPQTPPPPADLIGKTLSSGPWTFTVSNVSSAASPEIIGSIRNTSQQAQYAGIMYLTVNAPPAASEASTYEAYRGGCVPAGGTFMAAFGYAGGVGGGGLVRTVDMLDASAVSCER